MRVNFLPVLLYFILPPQFYCWHSGSLSDISIAKCSADSNSCPAVKDGWEWREESWKQSSFTILLTGVYTFFCDEIALGVGGSGWLQWVRVSPGHYPPLRFLVALTASLPMPATAHISHKWKTLLEKKEHEESNALRRQFRNS